MPANKDLKRLVRARMHKTGESYTAARAQITKPQAQSTAPLPAQSSAVSEISKKDYAQIAGMSDSAIKAKTGCAWEKWVTSLDYYGAETMTHSEIAELVHTKYKVPDWWTQTVTVGYERIRGLRARGQRRDGSYEASKSRTFDVPVEKLFDAWADSRKRKKWLDAEKVSVRTKTRPKSIRLGWTDGSIIALWFTSKGNSKSAVSVQHTKLPDRETASRLKQYWAEQLDELAQVFAAG